jgi:hypothetical protein
LDIEPVTRPVIPQDRACTDDNEDQVTQPMPETERLQLVPQADEHLKLEI